MNNLDVHVLQSFTRKLAYAAEKMAAPMDMRNVNAFLGAAGNQLGEVGRAAMDFGREPKPLPPAADDSLILNAPGNSSAGESAGRLVPNTTKKPAPYFGPEAPPTQEQSSSPVTPKFDTRTRQPIQVGYPLPGDPDPLPPLQERSWMDLLSDNAGSIGAAGAGGLGAMALARLFNSSKDDEEESSWAPWLAGAAGAGLGYGAWNYGPQLAEALSGMMGSGADKAAPQPPA